VKFWLVLLVSAAPLCLAASTIGPLGDDWFTTRPILDPSLADLRPGRFFRPLEQLSRMATGQHLALYPGLPRALVLCGHVVSALALRSLLTTFGARSWPATACAAAWLWFPGAMGGALSLDGATQTWSTAWGLLSVILLARGSLTWLLAAALASIAKESGVCWFLLSPWLAFIRTEELPQRELLLGSLGLVAYLVLRLGLGWQLELAARGDRYALGLDPVRLIRNAAQLAIAGSLPLDTVSWLSPRASRFGGVVTLLASLPATWLVLRQLPRASVRQGWRWLCAFMLVMGPHLVLGHVSELYAHPLSALVVLVLRPALLRDFEGPWTRSAAVLWLSASLLATGHKLVTMRASAETAAAVGRQLAVLSPRAPSSLCVVHAPEAAYYSVFDLGPVIASGFGRAALRHWGFREVHFFSAGSSGECPPAELTVRLVGDRVFREDVPPP